MAHKLTIEVPITETHAHGNVYYNLDLRSMSAVTDLPQAERESIVEALAQSDYIYTDLGRDLLTAFANAPESDS